MKNRRYRLETFSFYDRTGIAAHLEHMAAQGWLLDKIGSFFWRYRRIPPEPLTFSVCYFPKASQFDPGPSEDQETFYDFCDHTGWTLAAASAQLQAFYSRQAHPVPIETDPALEVETIHRSAKRSFLPSLAAFVVLGLLNLAFFLWQLSVNPIQTLSTPGYLLALVCWTVSLLASTVELLSYALWRRRALLAAEQEQFLAVKSHPLFQKVLIGVVLIALACWIVYECKGGFSAVMLLSMMAMAALIALIRGIQTALKRCRAPARTNRSITAVACVVLAVVMAVSLPYFLIRSLSQRTAGQDKLPLALEDLLEGDYTQGDRRLWRTDSPLLSRFEGHHGARIGTDYKVLNYSVVIVKFPALYELCRENLLDKYDDRDDSRVPEGWKRYYVPADPAPWGAQEAYQLVNEDTGPWDRYVLCYEGRLVEIDFDWAPTPEQMAVAARRLEAFV